MLANRGDVALIDHLAASGTLVGRLSCGMIAFLFFAHRMKEESLSRDGGTIGLETVWPLGIWPRKFDFPIS